jgi:3-phytase
LRPFCLLLLIALAGCAPAPPQPVKTAVDISPAITTEPVTDDADDPAFWVNPADPAQSLIIGTNKVKAPRGALAVFSLDGKLRQTVAGLDRPNNVDIEYGLPLNGAPVDIAVATERLQSQLRIFAVNAQGLRDITSLGKTKVFTDRKGEQAMPMGIALYKRPGDGAIFAIVAPKNGPTDGYLAQYRLSDDGAGKVQATFVRYFGLFSGSEEIEAVAVDDALGYVYYADEGDGIHKYQANPDHPAASAQLAHFGRAGFRANREGIALYPRPDGTGYLVCTDQLERSSEYHVFKREGEPGRPHDHGTTVKIVRGGADSTDGLDITSQPLGPAFPAGAMAAMNSRGRNFLLFDWRSLTLK